MSSTEVGTASSQETPQPGTIDMALEVVTLPVSDVERAKRFYEGSDGASTPTSPPATTSAPCK